MSGMFSSPSPPPPPPLPPVKAPEDSKRDNRIEALDRRRRGRAGTIETGFRGVLSGPGAADLGSKARFGE